MARILAVIAWVTLCAVGAGSAHADDPDRITTEPAVTIYGGRWCRACRSAARFFRRAGIAYVSRDVLRDPTAWAAMHRRVREEGMHLTVAILPLIDFRGTLIQGFDRARLRALIDARPPRGG